MSPRSSFVKAVLALAAGLSLLVTMPSARSAYLENDAPDEIREHPVPAPVPVHHALSALLSRVEVGRPGHFRHLTLFPLLIRDGSSRSGIRPLDEALRSGWVRVQEQEDAAIGSVLLRNDGAHPVLAMGGEMIVGGKQNRIVRDDVLLPAHSGFIRVPVYCGEQHRWTHDPRPFKGAGSIADAQLRSMAAGRVQQQAVWKEIDTRLDEAGVRSETRSYHQLYADPGKQEEWRAYSSALRRICTHRTVGVVAVSRGRIVGADLFGDPELLSALWDKICRSYAVSSGRPLHNREPGRHPVVSPDLVSRFLRRAQNSHMTRMETPGAGQLGRVSGGVHGSALTRGSDVVHAALFDDRAVIIHRDEPRPPEPIPYKTDDHLWR